MEPNMARVWHWLQDRSTTTAGVEIWLQVRSATAAEVEFDFKIEATWKT